MPYCPQCLIEYVDGTARCEDCGAELQPGSPPVPPAKVDLRLDKDVKLVPARIFSSPTAQMDAELAQNILETQGIPSALSGEGLADPFPVSVVHLLVREEEQGRAEQVLQDYLDTNASDSAAEAEKEEENRGGGKA